MTGRPVAEADQEAELRTLIDTIHRAERRIAELTGGQVDAVVDQTGAPYLLGAAQRRLRDAEADQRTLSRVLGGMLDALPAHIALLDAKGTITSVNAAWRRFAAENGATDPDAMVGQDYLRVCDASHGGGSADAQAAAATIRLVMSGRMREGTLDYPCDSPTERRWFRMIATPYRTDGDLGVVVLHVDISEGKFAEEALARSERLYRAIFEDNPQPTWLYDVASLRFLAVNEAAIRHYGWSREEFLGMTIADIRPPDEVPAMLERVAGSDAGAVRTTATRHRRKDGTVMDVEVFSRSLDSADGDARLVLALDVTERRAATAALADSQRRTALILDSVDDGIYGVDIHGRITFVNASAAELIGIDPDGLTGRDAHAELHHRRADGTAFPWEECPTYHTLRDGEPRRNHEIAHFRPDGSSFPTRLSVAPIVDADGAITGAVINFRDVTHELAIEEQLRQAQRLESVGQLTGGVAHDFNNLLTVIIGNAGILVDELGDRPDDRELATLTLAAAQRAAELTKRLLAFARRQTLAPREVDVGQLLAGMDSLLRRSLGEHIEIESVRAAGLWPALVDPSQLEGAILNLAINARDAMLGGGRLTIETANARLDDAYASQHVDVRPGQYVMIAVSDTGTGIDPAHLERVFDPFFTTKEIGQGTGLGLSMVHGFVKQSGGHIRIYSEVGHGTTVRMYLPRSFDGAMTDADQVMETVGGTETILLVEDDELVRRHAYDQLVSLGYRVLTAPNGPDAMTILRSRDDIDLLFTDVVMPGGMNGRILADAARVLHPSLPVLFTSGYTEDAIVHHGRLDPGVQLLSKPYRRADLARAVREALTR